MIMTNEPSQGKNQSISCCFSWDTKTGDSWEFFLSVLKKVALIYKKYSHVQQTFKIHINSSDTCQM